MGFRYVSAILMLMLVLTQTGCGTAASNPALANGNGTVTNPESEVYKPSPLLWEGAAKDGMLWSAFAFQIIGGEAATALLPGADDIAEFCPAYYQLREAQRVNFWAYLISAISKFETDFNPQARDLEADNDAVTGKRRYSEGLLHLSYGDVRKFAFCDLDWEKDKGLADNDKSRTIFDPFRNLECGIKILGLQVDTLKKISGPASYWKVLKPGVRNKVREIQYVAKNLPFCRI